ncbi:hypothetical protein [Streptomyces sp. NPDC096339]|uniref:hypothetical protein n=1 Tax=Streptomyces sp. NPDC096339 TaxID=3366086 RepID=UPI003822097E
MGLDHDSELEALVDRELQKLKEHPLDPEIPETQELEVPAGLIAEIRAPAVFIRAYQGPSPSGLVYISPIKGVGRIQYRLYSAGFPAYFEGEVSVERPAPIAVGPTPYIEIWIKPVSSAEIHAA